MSHIAALYTDHDSTPYQHLHRPAEDPHTPDLSGGASSAGTSVTLVPATAPAVTTRDDDEDEDQCKCWICFGEDSDSEGRWVRPCKCSLISHEECLLNWISENQKGIPFKKVRALVS
ncbi:hypothetical protein BC936DRAFT_149211 [Jimgerdemannia flammicorona]|uniref:RING-CH-type domain-containing protein n=1 Tax=Jimgerdemannia flammicorona TaxID=994334 RepID=A0A433D1C0_9FUNG|nr:hypothetical protein BC936DRAFT_149211 [Jimgerdemannia flammicorona]